MLKCKHYLLGCPKFKVITDHKPLVSCFSKPMDDTSNVRIMRIRQKLTNFNFLVEWVEGKAHAIADALSRAPVFAPTEQDCEEEEVHLRAVIASDPRLQFLFDEAERDQEYQEILNTFNAGVDLAKLPNEHPAKALKNIWNRISVYEGSLIALDSNRIYVPVSARRKLLQLGHEAHCGAEKTKAQFKQLYFWPSMANEIDQLVQGCKECRYHQPSQPVQPLKPTIATRPMEQVGIDLFESAGVKYLCMIDRFSGFPFAAKMTTTTSSSVIDKLKGWFLDFGLPKVIRSDGGRQFASQEFNKWCEDNSIRHDTSSPHNSSSNGHAESGVKVCKQLLEKLGGNWTNFTSGLFAWRNNSCPNGYSPAQLMFGRRQQTSLPALPNAFKPINMETAIEVKERQRAKMKMAFDQKAHEIPDLNIGDVVVVQNQTSKKWDREGKVVGVSPTGRSYDIKFQDGGVLKRNRRFIRKI